MSKPKFRASQVGRLMTEPKTVKDKEAGNLSEGAKTYCLEVFAQWKYKREKQIFSKYFEKGNETEEDAITLVSKANLVILNKNSENLANEYLTGTPDLFTGADIRNAQTIRDTKSRWDIYSFLEAKHKPIDPVYYGQLQAYMWLTNAPVAYLDNCLVNATADLISDERRRIAYSMRVMDNDSDPAYLKACHKLERSMIFDIVAFCERYPHFDLATDISRWAFDIPWQERIHSVEIKRDDAYIERMKAKIEKAWEYIASLG